MWRGRNQSSLVQKVGIQCGHVTSFWETGKEQHLASNMMDLRVLYNTMLKQSSSSFLFDGIFCIICFIFMFLKFIIFDFSPNSVSTSATAEFTPLGSLYLHLVYSFLAGMMCADHLYFHPACSSRGRLREWGQLFAHRTSAIITGPLHSSCTPWLNMYADHLLIFFYILSFTALTEVKDPRAAYVTAVVYCQSADMWLPVNPIRVRLLGVIQLTHSILIY